MHAFLTPFLVCRPAEKTACTSPIANAQATRGEQLQNLRSATRRQRGALCLAISQQVQNVRVFESLAECTGMSHHHPSFFTVSTGRGCKIRIWNAGDVTVSSDTRTQAFVPSTRDSISSLYPSVTSVVCLPSVCQRGSLRSSSLFFLSCGQQHQDEFGHVLIILIHRSWPAASVRIGVGRRLLRKEKAGEIYDSSLHLRLCLDRRIRH